MFRREPALRLPAWYHDMPMGGWPLFVLNARFGDTGYLDEPMAAYRVHAGGYWSGQSRLVQQCRRLQVYEAMSAHFRRRHDDVIGPGAFACCYDLAMFHEASGDLRAARACAWRALAWGTARGRCGGRPGAGRQVLRVLLRSSVPAAAYRAARRLRRTLAGPRGCRG